jgi:hypothetical protein
MRGHPKQGRQRCANQNQTRQCRIPGVGAQSLTVQVQTQYWDKSITLSESFKPLLSTLTDPSNTHAYA